MKLIKYNFSKFLQPTLDKHIKQKLIIKIFVLIIYFLVSIIKFYLYLNKSHLSGQIVSFTF